MSNSYKLDAIVHSHFNTGTDSTRGLSVFSPDDLWTMCQTFNEGNVDDPSIFTLGLVTKNNTQYLLKIHNLTKFRRWANRFTRRNLRQLIMAYFVDYKIISTNSNELNEKNFLMYLLDNTSGLKLFRGNSDFTEWTPLGLDANRNVIAAPCQ